MKGHTCCSKLINRGLHIAVNNEDLFWMRTFLVCPQIDINMRNNEGSTPLNLAVMKDLEDMVQILLGDQRIDVNKPNTLQKTNALLISSEEAHINIMKLLLLHPQTFANQENANGDTALANKGTKQYGDDNIRKYYRVLKLLLRCPKVNVTDKVEVLNEPFMKQAWELRSVSESTCCLDVRRSILMAAWMGDFRAIRGLLTCPGSESNINAVDNWGKTPLYIASMRGHLHAVEVLLANRDEDVNHGVIVDGGTAFSISSEKSHLDVLGALIAHGQADANRGWCRDSWVKYSQLCKLMDHPFQEAMNPPTAAAQGTTTVDKYCATKLLFFFKPIQSVFKDPAAARFSGFLLK